MNYLVTATGSLGYVENFNTTQTRLSATLPCGQEYNATVRGQGSKCDSIPSGPAFFKTRTVSSFTPHIKLNVICHCVSVCMFTPLLFPQPHVSPEM